MKRLATETSRIRAAGRLWALAGVLTLFLACPTASSAANAPGGGGTSRTQEPLPLLDSSQHPYRTPLAGQGFRARVFGHEVTVPPQNRRSVSSWDLGFGAYWPPPENSALLPVGSLYFWRHPDNKTLLRAEVAGVYNDIFFSRSPSRFQPFEGVLTFTNYTLPTPRKELIDGQARDAEELRWGEVRLGFGAGLRRQVAPGQEDNMLAVDLTVEPGWLYFAGTSKTADNFVVPRDSFDIRSHLQLRWDALARNLLDLPHRGFAAGSDLIYGYRPGWRDWGLNGENAAADGREYLLFSAYLLAAGKVPLIDSDRQRLVGSLHGGLGRHLDRFSSLRIGGGEDPMGEEYGSTWRPVIPGAVMQEFLPHHYLVAVGEYRWEPLFFTFVSLRASLAWLDRQHLSGEVVSRQDDFLSSLGARLTTGFFFGTRLQLSYNHNFGVRRGHERGGNEVVLHLSGPL